MNTLIRNLVAATVLTAAFAGSASAMTATDRSVWADLNASPASIHGINLSVNHGVVTLAGDVNDAITRQQIERAVRGSTGVTGVINLITF